MLSIPEIKTPKLNWGVLNELPLHAKRINSGFKLEITTQIYSSIFKSSKLKLKLATLNRNRLHEVLLK